MGWRGAVRVALSLQWRGWPRTRTCSTTLPAAWWRTSTSRSAPAAALPTASPRAGRHTRCCTRWCESTFTPFSPYLHAFGARMRLVEPLRAENPRKEGSPGRGASWANAARLAPDGLLCLAGSSRSQLPWNVFTHSAELTARIPSYESGLLSTLGAAIRLLARSRPGEMQWAVTASAPRCTPYSYSL